ncbi:MAG: phosphotriesterase family protein, partial [Flavitalea sp.]
MNRRYFLRLSTPLVFYQPAQNLFFTGQADDMIMTVTGPLPLAAMGLTLTHEHLFSTFGLDPEEKTDYDTEQLMATVLPFLEQAKSAGCKTIFDCTAAYFGRHAGILKAFAEKSGLHIVTNTGFYGAAYGRYIPAYVHSQSAEEISNHWLNEFKNGIENTGIKPGFIKLGFNNGP